MDLATAREGGLRFEGDVSALERLQPRAGRAGGERPEDA
jgi:hypothetical protein